MVIRLNHYVYLFKKKPCSFFPLTYSRFCPVPWGCSTCWPFSSLPIGPETPVSLQELTIWPLLWHWEEQKKPTAKTLLSLLKCVRFVIVGGIHCCSCSIHGCIKLCLCMPVYCQGISQLLLSGGQCFPSILALEAVKSGNLVWIPLLWSGKKGNQVFVFLNNPCILGSFLVLLS